LSIHAASSYIMFLMLKLFSSQLVYLLLFSTSSALPSNIWQVHIDNDPAPSPQDGPPLSANAIRDPAYIPVQVGSIVGAYFLWIIIISIAILTVGRRLRNSARTTPKMEILKQPPPIQQPKAFDPSPISPIKANPWDPSPVSPSKKNAPWSPKSWGSFKKHRRQDSLQSSVVTFDESVIAEDRARNEIEMDRLYAAVAEHDAQQSQSKTSSQPPRSPLSQNPPELQHLKYPASPKQFNPQSFPLSPPPEDSFRQPTSPLRESTSSSRRVHKPPPLSFNNPPSRNSSRSSFSSFVSFGKKKTPSIRDLPISPPMGSPDMSPEAIYSESEPLTPRYYKPGPPPTPPQRFEPLASPTATEDRRYYFSPSIRSSRSSVATGNFSPSQTPRTATFPAAILEEQNRPGIAITLDGASTPDLPALNSAQYLNATPRIETPPREKGRKPAPLTLPGTTNSSQATLPLRTAPLPLRALRSPNSTRPVSQIRNTEITRPDPGRLRAPGTAGMMPSTPYSPFYMPQTPLTPMTPSRLVTREERKRAKKEEGRRALTADDMVVNEEDMWGDGY
jgi:hypothetical protein